MQLRLPQEEIISNDSSCSNRNEELKVNFYSSSPSVSNSMSEESSKNLPSLINI